MIAHYFQSLLECSANKVFVLYIQTKTILSDEMTEQAATASCNCKEGPDIHTDD